MIDTVNSAPDHWTKGVFTIGSGPEVILIAGACRVVPYANYFHYLNEGNRFTIHLMNVVNYNWVDGVRHDGAEYVTKYEQDASFLAMLKSVKWYMHEHVANYGMVNNDKTRPKNIYQFGMAPELDISLPNFNNVYMMFQELVTFDPVLRAMAIRDFNESTSRTLRPSTAMAIAARGEAEILKFLSMAWISDLPSFASFFEKAWRDVRYFWTGNHISNHFSIMAFQMMNDKFFEMDIPREFWGRISKEDLFATPTTPVTEYDVTHHKLTWHLNPAYNTSIQPLTL